MTEQEQIPAVICEKKVLSDEVLASLKKRFPEQFFGTREWELKVRLDAFMKDFCGHGNSES